MYLKLYQHTIFHGVHQKHNNFTPLPTNNTLVPNASAVEFHQRQQHHNGPQVYIKSTGAQYQWWISIQTMAAFLAVLLDIETMSRLTFLTVSSTHAALPWGPWAARIFSRQHILNSDGGEIPAAYRQQVWGQGGLSKDVKSMKDSLMSFPLPLQTKGLECRRMPADMLQMEEIRSSE